MEWCEFDLGLRTAVSSSYLVYHTYSGKIDTMIHTMQKYTKMHIYNVYVSAHTQPTHAVHDAPSCPQVCMYAIINLMQIVHYAICKST